MKRFWRILKYLGLALLGLVGISLTWLAVANARANARLEQKLAELRAAGEPITMVDLAHKPIPPEDNAATYLRRAKSDIEAIQEEVNAASDASTAAEQKAFDDGHPSPEMVKALRAAFEAYPHAVPLILRAADCSDYDSQLDYTLDPGDFIESLFPIIQQSRGAMRVLNYRSLLLLAEGQTDEALKISIAMLCLTRHFDREPMQIGYLVALACRGVAVETTSVALRAGPPSDASRDALEAELSRQDMAKHYRHALTTERAFGLQLFHETPNPLVGHLYMKLPMGKNDQCDFLEYMDFAIQSVSRPYSDSGAQASAKRVLDRSGPLTNSVAPAIQATHEAHCRIQAEMRCLRVLNALARHGYGPQAEEPKLADLGLPADVLIDPYNGQPLHLKKLPDGWLIYSVGTNLKDDGGKLNEEYEDVGLGPITAQNATEKASE